MSTPMDVDRTRGIKRKADTAPLIPGKIRALDQDVVNLIAAGEIIVAPVNALKELIENSVDAGSTSIDIQALEGGLKMLQIQDNGCGIDENDLPLLCVRHTTSKLQQFEDLRTIETYGFRGEALASISHIAHVKVATKVESSPFSWTAKFEGPKLAAPPTKSAGVQGTRITVEDLFYNVPNRRRAFRSGNDEFNKILDMVAKYAVHCWKVSFTCKKIDAKGASKTVILVTANTKIVDRIRNIYGSGVANELFEFATADVRYKFKASGWASNANYSVKRMQLVLFINNRSVESSNIKKAIEQTYSGFLPKGGHPWVYLSINIDPRNVDVNVHPTKREVNFIAEDEIIQSICEEIRSKMAAVDSSRTFYTQTLLPGTNSQDNTPSSATKTPVSNTKATARNDSTLIRTDATARKITSMLPTIDPSSPAAGKPVDSVNPIYETVECEEIRPYLRSIRDLRKDARTSMHSEGTELMGTHIFVGILCYDKRIAIVQSGRKLYMVDYRALAVDLFYQIGITNFQNFGVIRLSPPLAIKPLMQKAARFQGAVNPALHDDPKYEPDAGVELVYKTLIERRELLQEYFSIEITPNGELRSLPILIKGYSPSLARLPQFLLRLGPNVCWTKETPCFHSLITELAKYYAPERLPNPLDTVPTVKCDGTRRSVLFDPAMLRAIEDRERHVRHAIEHVMFPAFKDRLLVTQETMKSGITEVADLKTLYRTFERC